MNDTRAAAMEMLLVVVKVVCIEISALAVANLLQSQNLAAKYRHGLPGTRFHHVLEKQLPAVLSHFAPSTA